MGNNSSSNEYVSYPTSDFASEHYVRVNDNNEGDFSFQPFVLSEAKNTSRLLKSAYHGIWSMVYPEKICPNPRVGHFYCSTPDGTKAFIGYGSDMSKSYNDFWYIDLINLEWKQIHLSGDLLSSRSGCSAVFYNNLVYVFGGYSSPDYFGDLHSINIENGIVTLIQTNGDKPEPRSTPLMAIYNNKLFLWGGYNTSYLTDLSILNFNNLTWCHKPTGINGRTSVPYVNFGSNLYSYGGSKTDTLLIIDLEEEIVKEIPTTGSPPPFKISSAGITYAEGYLFFFGGKSKPAWTLMYALDIKKMWWFVFHVLPDGETTTYTDGRIEKIGLFLLPRIDSFGMHYVPKTRSLIGCLGNPFNNPPPFFIITIGEALPIIKLREDMIDMFNIKKY